MDRKADLALVRKVQASKVDLCDFKAHSEAIHDHNEKIKHITVFVSELSKLMLPEKGYGPFTKDEDIPASVE